MHGNKAWDRSNHLWNTETFDRIDGELMDFEWNIFPGFNTLQLSDEVKCLLFGLEETPGNVTGRILFTPMFMTFVEQMTTKKNVWQMSNSYLCTRGDLEKRQLVLKRSGTVSVKTVHKEYGTILLKRCWLEFAESGCPIFRARRPLSRGQLKGKGHGKLSIHCAADVETVETIFRIIVSANQLSLYGAVAEICEEYESFHERTGRHIVMGQSSSSLVLCVINTEAPLDCDDEANQDLLLQQYGEKIEKLSQQDKLSKFCMDARFLNVVEIGQYFRT